MKSKIILFIVSLIAWSLLTWVPDWQHIAVGVVVCGFVAYMIGDLFTSRPHLLQNPARYWYFLGNYVPVFIWEVIKANFDVAYRVLHPNLLIKPGIVKVRTELKTDVALTFLANSITLTPGTMTVDIDKDNGILYIHWINTNVEDIDATTKSIVERFETILKKIFE
ncbi:Na+/H+ antiporter subunit E [Candidatus Omnitrophota bacterium]